MDLGLTNKTVFITGGSSGIGQAIALAYGREPGVHVAFTYYQNEASARDTVRAIEQSGATATAVYLNLAEPASITAAVAAVTARTGRLDVLVNNAVQWVDPTQRRRQHELTRQQWEEVVGVNLFGTAQVTRQALPFMQRAQWGRIVTLSSDLALDSMPGSGPYSTLKAALLGFNANLVEEYSAEGILSNVVLPSWTLTARARKSPPAFQQAAALAFPTRRITEPEEVASLVLYLGSAANGHVNGEAIKVTGKGCQPMLTSLFQQHRTALSVANKN